MSKMHIKKSTFLRQSVMWLTQGGDTVCIFIFFLHKIFGQEFHTLRHISLARREIWQICLLALFSFAQPLTWMKTNVTEAKHTSGNMSLVFQLKINMPKDKCNTLPLKYWTPLLWSRRLTWNDWYFISHQSVRFHSHTYKHAAYVLLSDNW